MNRLAVVTLFAAALGAAAGCTLSVEASAPDVEITEHDLTFAGVPPAGSGDVSTETSYSQDHSKLDVPSGVDAEIKTLGVTLMATSVVDDLSFIHDLRITMSSPGADAIELGSYEPAPGAAVGKQISLTSLNPLNVFNAWNADSATFTLVIAGALPATDWTADVVVKFAGSVSYRYSY